MRCQVCVFMLLSFEPLAFLRHRWGVVVIRWSGVECSGGEGMYGMVFPLYRSGYEI